MKLLLLMGFLIPLFCASVAAASAPNPRLSLRYRKRVVNDQPDDEQAEPAPVDYEIVDQTVRWDPRKTAVVVCDMWDRHWCRGATLRVDELAPRMNEVLNKARQRGMLIVHAPSETMDFYAGTPQRKQAMEAPAAAPPEEIHTWRGLDPLEEPELPIDDSDGGCDDESQCVQGNPWTRQHPAITIAPDDVITDRGDEVYNLFVDRDITNVIIMGVHTNMCILRRPFAIRYLVALGLKVALMRDMTDSMYNSRQHPYVDHFRGTDLVIEHIEKYCCPTLFSTDLTGQPAFCFQSDQE